MKKITCQIIPFKKKSTPEKEKILSLDLYIHGTDTDFSYRMKKVGNNTESDEFVASALVCVIEDIVCHYNNDPSDILETTQELMIKLGFDYE